MYDRHFFDMMAPEWDSRERMSTAGRIAAVLAAAGVGRGHSVLDLGAGTGVLEPKLMELVGESGCVTAVDFSLGMLGVARSKWRGRAGAVPRFLHADFENEEIAGTYDRIILYCVYPHLRAPYSTLRRLLRRNLAPQGALVIAFPVGEDEINAVHSRGDSGENALPSPQALALRLRGEGIDAAAVEMPGGEYVVSVKGEIEESAAAAV